jgi:SAM-dependent methyltransferase
MEDPNSGSTWDRFWSSRDELDEIYPSSPIVITTLLRHLPEGSPRVLEIGAGTGRDTASLEERGARAVALDSSPASLALVARANPDLVGKGIVGGDALHLPFGDGCFDIVFHQGVLEHFGNPLAFLRENHRVTAAGGLLIVDVPQTFHVWTVLKRAALRVNRWFAGWETSYTIAQLETLVYDAGYDIVGTYGDWMVPSLGYRLLRESLKPVGVRLPLRPHGPQPIRRVRDRFREKMLAPRPARYLAHTVGVVAQRPAAP